MGSAQSARKEVDEKQVVMRKLISDFNYLDVDHDGWVSFKELEGYHREFDTAYDAAAVHAEFDRLDKNGDGSVQLIEYLEARGVDVAGLRAAALDDRRLRELRAERDALAGTMAVEIVPDGSECAEVGVSAEAYVADGVVAEATVECFDAVAVADQGDGDGADVAVAALAV
ncbi:hypothetical protein M885DRAFT_514457 [Pelagophyceae sp. CCMP2097]|nr:hypothetical protein M885DRAFT_514457 [Pelagophyceae sp. CCMP2097]|mmetsp:Transcript_4415/g.13930  ORF Transcript_4415/g.13930 Transcript_4415/m.13930 type:complete len:171 (+) Transcript_4415:96-608(+)